MAQGFNHPGMFIPGRPSFGVQAATRYLLRCSVQQWPPPTESSANRGLDLNVTAGTASPASVTIATSHRYNLFLTLLGECLTSFVAHL